MNRIHDTAIIGPGVELGVDNVVGPYAVILGDATIGDGNWVGPHVVIGTPPEVRGAPHPAGWDPEPSVGGLRIGSRNVIREFTNIERGFAGATVIGDDCYVMTKAYVPHDCQLGNQATVSSGVMMGGHSFVGEGANLGLGAVVHQRRVIGPGAMVGMGAVVTRDVPPFAMAYGNPARVHGANRVGLRRAGYDDDTIARIDAALRGGADLAALLQAEVSMYEDARRRSAGD